MSQVLINATTRTKIAEGSCSIKLEGNSQLIHISNENYNVVDTTYANGIKYVISDTAIYARSTNKDITLEVTPITTKGANGANGEKGDKGDKGDKGNDGYTPIKGVDYFDGAQGYKGETGIQGIQGATGANGEKGDIGLTGSKGDTGVAQIDVNTGLPFLFSILTQSEYDGLATKEANTLYFIKE